jgi:hypothetical protein
MALLGEIVTPQWLKDRFLFGIDLTDDDGVSYPDALYQHSIDASIAIVEGELDIVVSGLNEYTERYDTHDAHHEAFFLIHTDHRPLREITKVQVQFGSFEPSTLPNSWMQIASEKTGQMQIVPGPEGIGSVLFGGQAPFLGLSGLLGRPYTPLWFSFTYKAGYDGVDNKVPNDILELIGLLAVQLPLDTAGDLIVGAGIASKSISMDGIATSINTTASSTNAGYGARMLSMRRRYDKLLKEVKRKYRIPNLMIF